MRAKSLKVSKVSCKKWTIWTKWTEQIFNNPEDEPGTGGASWMRSQIVTTYSQGIDNQQSVDFVMPEKWLEEVTELKQGI